MSASFCGHVEPINQSINESLFYVKKSYTIIIWTNSRVASDRSNTKCNKEKRKLVKLALVGQGQLRSEADGRTAAEGSAQFSLPKGHLAH